MAFLGTLPQVLMASVTNQNNVKNHSPILIRISYTIIILLIKSNSNMKKTFRLFSSLIGFIAFATVSFSQINCCENFTVLGDDANNGSWGVKVYDGFTYVAGYNETNDETYATFTKLDSNNDIVWELVFDQQSVIFDFEQSNSGGFFLVGRTMPIRVGTSWQDNSTLISHVKDDGTIDFINRYDNFGRENVLDILKHPNPVNADAPYYLINFKNNTTSGVGTIDDAVLMNLNEAGEIVWAREFEYERDDQYGFKLIPYENGSVLGIGDSFPAQGGTIIQYDGSNGDIIKSTNGGGVDFRYRDIKVLSNGNMVCAGHVEEGNNIRGSFLSLIDSDFNYLNGFQMTELVSLSGWDLVVDDNDRIIYSYTTPQSTMFLVEASLDGDSLVFENAKTIENISFVEGPFMNWNNGLSFGATIVDHQNSLGANDILVGFFPDGIDSPCLIDTTIDIAPFEYTTFDISLDENDYVLPDKLNDVTASMGMSSKTTLCSGSEEICSNGIDDDMDGLTDCDDPDIANECCCREAVQVMVTGPNTACRGEFITLDAGSGFMTYTWTYPDRAQEMGTQTLTTNQDGVHLVEVTDSCGHFSVFEVFIQFVEEVESFVNIQLCDGEVFESNGEVYDTAGTYQQTLTSVAGCDSLLNISLAFGLSFQVNETYELCAGDSLSINGDVFNAPGNYVQNLMTSIGCDSTIIIEILEGQLVTNNMNFSICEGESVIVNGEEYFDSGVFEQTLISSTECDSLLIIEIVESPAVDVTENYTICAGEVVVVNNQEYNSAGTYTQTIPSSTTCDTSLIIVITEDASIRLSESFSGCEGTPIFVYGSRYDLAGTYSTVLENPNGCDTILDFEIVLIPSASSQIVDFISANGSVDINGTVYDQAGDYTQAFMGSNGCDSILNINLIELSSIVHYDMENCDATLGTENISFSEFEASYPSTLDCSLISASQLGRVNPDVNGHSCTGGVNGTTAICVSSLDACTYDKDSEMKIRFDVTVEATSGIGGIHSMSFYQNAPPVFDWINGPNGANNYPTLYGIRVLKDGSEIYFKDGNLAAQDWSLEEFSFGNDVNFQTNGQATFTFELMGYCLADNGAQVAAWDLDDIQINGYCLDDLSSKFVSGTLTSTSGTPMENVEVYLESEILSTVTKSNEDGLYVFEELAAKEDYQISCLKDDDVLNGVSTLDIILIQKHILGSERFENPTNFIAADVNNDHAITALDLIEIRKLILGKTERFENNNSWNFLETSVPHNEANIFNNQQYYQLNKLRSNVSSVDFDAIKIGDVNGTHELFQSNAVIENRNVNSIELNYVSYKEGDQVKTDFYLTENAVLSGLQLSLSHLQAGDDLSIVSGRLNLEPQHFNRVDHSQLNLSYNNVDDLAINKNEVLFSIISSEGLLNMKMTKERNSEIYFNNANIQKTLILKRGEEVDLPFKESFEFKVYPNPSANQINIVYNVLNENDVEIKMHDIHGRTVYSKTMDSKKGINNMTLSKEQLGLNPGVYIIQIKQEDKIRSQKVHLID